MNRKLFVGLIVFILILPMAISARGEEATKNQLHRLSLEKLFSEPPIYGRQPSGAQWSPDGSMVAFYWNEKGGDILDIYLVPATGERPVNITNWKEEETPDGARFFGGGRLQWSPDSQRLLYVYKGDLFIIP
ncbi:MAG: TolB family protein, partial [Acidobacteriota bacterium]